MNNAIGVANVGAQGLVGIVFAQGLADLAPETSRNFQILQAIAKGWVLPGCAGVGRQVRRLCPLGAVYGSAGGICPAKPRVFVRASAISVQLTVTRFAVWRIC